MVVFQREHFERALRSVGSGAIDEDFDFLELRQDTIRQLFDRLDNADITRANEQVLRVFARSLDRLTQCLLAPANQGDLPVLFHQRDCDGLADAAAGAGDNGCFVHKLGMRRNTHNRSGSPNDG